MKIKKMIWIVVAIVVAAFVAWIILLFWPKIGCKNGYTVEEQKEMCIIAHRGGASQGAENSLDCIAKGIAAGADMIEIDIHVTKDGYIVVNHDPTVDRTSNGTGAINEMTLSEIRELRLKDQEGNLTNEKIPTIEEVFALINGRCELLIEIKRIDGSNPNIEEKVIEAIDKAGARQWSVVQSFDDSVLFEMHRLDPSIPLEKLIFGVLPFTHIAFDTGFNGFNLDKYDFVQSINMYEGMATPMVVNKIRNAGKGVKIWTAGAPDQTPHLPVTGIITNNPQDWHHERR